MARKNVENKNIHYRRLPGRGLRREGIASLFTRTWGTLWMAPDHLLSVDTHLFSEEYKRFYFRDIQAIVIGKNRLGLIWNIAFSLFASFWIMLGILLREYPEVVGSLLFMSGFFALLLVINIWRGPTCTCYLITAVHKEILPSLDRIKKAEKISNTLRPHIEKAQKDLL